MSAPNITRQQVDAAAPLDFPAKPQRQELTITVTATVDGFPVELCYTGSIDQLLAVTKRLRELGAEPVSAPPAPPAQPERRAAKRTQAAYNDDGDPVCPVHNRKLVEGQYGLYCTAKAAAGDVSDKKGYCGLKFAE